MLPSPMRALGRRAKETSPDELHLAVLTGRTRRIKHLVQKGVHIESVNTLGETPLFCAAYGGDYEVVKVLLRLGANPNRRCGSGGAAPIHAASFRGSRRVLRLLVEAGGDLSLRDAELQTPRDYALKQPAPVRREKILSFLDLLFAMTLQRMNSACSPPPPPPLPQSSSSTLPFSSSSSATLPSSSSSSVGGSNHGSLKRNSLLRKGFFGGSQLSLSRKPSHQSTASVWSSTCVSEVSEASPTTNSIANSKEIVLTPNLHKSVSCHLLDQLCVTTSLPLLSPAQLNRPHTPSPAYTCGGPTVYSSFSWLGTPVTVRRPTPALSLSRQGRIINDGGDDDSPDEDAVKSLLQELSFLRRLRHPGFLEVMAACHVTHPSPDHVTLVYQHVPHGSLYHHLHVQHHDLSIGGAVDILIGLVEALLFMHAHGWFHCGLSSHAVHLVSLSSAKLGGFEYAFESQVKGVGMRGEHISKVSWLRPWQAPETVLERMVSVRSEVYSVAAIIWELWSGMPPWAGVEEDEICKKVSNGEVLPPLKGSSVSLVSYLTEYGLKWNAHERELDLQEAHTMLRSLRIQCHEDERVPAVTSWGPPSIPNTPVVGRHCAQSSSYLEATHTTSNSSSSSGELRLGDGELLSLRHHREIRDRSRGDEWREIFTSKKEVANGTEERDALMETNSERDHEKLRRQISLMSCSEDKDRKSSVDVVQQNTDTSKTKGSRDSGFSTSCSRTPSPTCDDITSSKTPSIITSTPVRLVNSSVPDGRKPDLLPNKVTPKAFLESSVAKVPNSPPDLLLPQPKSSTPQPNETDENFDFIKNAAKRAFLQTGGGGEGHESDGSLSSSSSPTYGRARKALIFPQEVVKRGLSLSNICGSALNCYPSATVFTRTTSHISLSSSSSGDICGKRPPYRTISQVTLTLRKFSSSSSSSSSDMSNDSQTKFRNEIGTGVDSIGKLGSSASDQKESDKPSATEGIVGESKGSTEERRRVSSQREYRYSEIDGIKPASHQLTRHSSSCSLASGPSSPSTKNPVSISLLGSSKADKRITNSHDCLSTSVKPTSKFKTQTLPSRPLSVFNEAPLASNSKVSSRRHFDPYKRSNRRLRRKQELEFEEEFIDDEFDANLYDQPHMQLSVGSSENLLDSRMSFTLVHDSASSSSLSPSQHSRTVTSSEDDDFIDNATKRGKATPSGKVPERKEDSAKALEGDKGCDGKELQSEACGERKSARTPLTSESEWECVWKDPHKLEEPLKSSKATRTLEKKFSNYLPTYSITSDTEDSGDA